LQARACTLIIIKAFHQKDRSFNGCLSITGKIDIRIKIVPSRQKGKPILFKISMFSPAEIGIFELNETGFPT
jgi:hypothetical protein